MESYDVAIVGASVPGLCLANYLVKKGMRIAMVDIRNFKKIGQSIELEMFSERAIDYLEKMFNIRIPKKFIESRSEYVEFKSMNGKGIKIDQKAYLINKRELSAYLMGKIIDKDNFDLYDRHNVRGLITHNNDIIGIRIHNISRGTIKDLVAKTIVDSSGSSSIIRRLTKDNGFFNKEVEDYDKLIVRKEELILEEVELDGTVIILSPSEIGRGYMSISKGRDDKILFDFGTAPRHKGANDQLDNYKKIIFGDNILKINRFEQEEVLIRRPFLSLVYKNVVLLGSPGSQINPLVPNDILFKLKAAYIAGTTISSIGDEKVTTKKLWNYNKEFMAKAGVDIAILEATRDYLTSFGDNDLDYVLENKVVPKELFYIFGNARPQGGLVQTKLLIKPRIMKKSLALRSYINKIKELFESYPDYDEFHIWKKKVKSSINKVRESFLI